ncbi:hypothetical protein M0804_006528 [Polistes exclamans]|nr:hypothetical protein M0804_006528 [Polistes exclamans]
MRLAALPNDNCDTGLEDKVLEGRHRQNFRVTLSKIATRSKGEEWCPAPVPPIATPPSAAAAPAMRICVH